MKSIRRSGAEETLEVTRAWPLSLQVLWMQNVSGGDKENECMTARLCRVEDGVYSWVPLICRVRFTSPVSAARQDLWPEDRPAHGVVLPQTSRGHRKRGRKNRWGVLLWTRPGPRCRFYLLSCLCNARLPQHPSTDVIFMWQNDSRKRIIHFYLLPCEELSSLSAAVLTLPLHHYQHPPFPLFCVLVFSFFLPLWSKILCVQRPWDGGDGVCESCVWDRPGQSPGWVLQNEEFLHGNSRQMHNRLGSVAGNQGCQRVSALSTVSALITSSCYLGIAQTWPDGQG